MPVFIAAIVIGALVLLAVCAFLVVWSWCYAKRMGEYWRPSFSGSTLEQEDAFNNVYQTGYQDDEKSIELELQSNGSSKSGDEADDTEKDATHVFEEDDSAPNSMVTVPILSSSPAPSGKQASHL